MFSELKNKYVFIIDILFCTKKLVNNIYNIIIKNIDLPFITLEVECAKGTYIRALARDIGQKLGCGGYLFKLRRTDIGDYSVDQDPGRFEEYRIGCGKKDIGRS